MIEGMNTPDTLPDESRAIRKNAILVPGRPDKKEYYDPTRPTNSNDIWFPWLSKQLILQDILAVALEIPRPWQPRYDIWKKEFERFDITPETILVGHSCGGGFLIRYLSDHPDLKVGKVALVAPWTNPSRNPKSDTADFFDFTIDPDLASRTDGLSIFYSTNDSKSILDTITLLRQELHGVQWHEFHDKGHFVTRTLGGEAFPELLEVLTAE